MVLLVQSSPSSVANVASGEAIAENTNPSAAVEQLRLTPEAIDDIVAQAAVIAKADMIVQQQHALASMGFDHDDIKDMLDLAAEAQAQRVALDRYPQLKRIADEMASRLHAFSIINKHGKDANPALFAEVSRGLKQETLQAALTELDRLAADLGYEASDEPALVDKAVRKQEEAPDLTRGLVAYYPFTHGSVDDFSGHNNHGTAFGDPYFIEDLLGNKRSALRLDGIDDYVLIHNSTSLNPDEITVTAMVKTLSDWSRCGNNVVIHKPFTSHVSPYYQWHLGITGYLYDTDKPYFASNGYVSLEDDYMLSSNFYLDEHAFSDRWTFLAFSYDSGYLSTYMNGSLTSRKNVIGHHSALEKFKTDVFIGKQGSLHCYTPADVDEIRVFDRRLTEQEILNLFLNDFGILSPEVSPSPSVLASPSTPATASPDNDIHIDRDVFMAVAGAFAALSAGAVGLALYLCACKQRQDAVHNDHQRFTDEDDTPRAIAVNVEMIRPSSSVSQAPRATLFQLVQIQRNERQTNNKVWRNCSMM